MRKSTMSIVEQQSIIYQFYCSRQLHTSHLSVLFMSQTPNAACSWLLSLGSSGGIHRSAVGKKVIGFMRQQARAPFIRASRFCLAQQMYPRLRSTPDGVDQNTQNRWSQLMGDAERMQGRSLELDGTSCCRGWWDGC